MHFNTLIIMSEDSGGYGNRSRKPSGYCKLTMPNRIICYVQGLKQLPKGQMYRLYLLSKDKQESVEAGAFQVGLSGNKETRWNMDPTNINRSGLSADQIDGAIIAVEGDGQEEFIVPLVGFSSDPYRWESLIKQNKEPEPQVKELDPKKAIKKEESKEENKELITLKEELARLKAKLKESEETIRRLKVNSKDLSDDVTDTVGINEYVSDFIRKFDTDDVTSQKDAYREIGLVFDKRIPINPFELQNTGIKWVRITQEDLAELPLLDETWINEPLITNANRDYKHFILGRDELKLAYYVGIPGVYNPNKDSGLELDKVERFACCHDTQPKTGEVGYWIARL